MGNEMAGQGMDRNGLLEKLIGKVCGGVRSSGRKYFLVARTSLQNTMVYRTNFLFDLLFYAFLIFIFLNLWRTVYGQGRTIAGYSLSQMIWYCIVTEMVILSGSNVFEDLNREIKGGEIAYLLNKPFHYIWYQLANSIGQSGVKLMLNAALGFVLGLIYIGPLAGFTVGHLPALCLIVAGALLLNFLAFTCLGLTAFWFEENIAFFWIYQKLLFMLGMFLPIEFFPAWLGRLTSWLPFSYVTYGPARLAVDFSWAQFYQIGGVQFAYIVLLFFLAFFLYRKGVKQLNVNGG